MQKKSWGGGWGPFGCGCAGGGGGGGCERIIEVSANKFKLF